MSEVAAIGRDQAMTTSPVNTKLTLGEIALQALDPSSTQASCEATVKPGTRGTAATVTRLATLAARSVGAARASIMLSSEYFTRCSGSPVIEVATFDRSSSLAATVMMSGKPLVLGNVTRAGCPAKALEASASGSIAFIGVPILALSGAVIGAVCIRDTRERRFTAEDVESLEFIADFISREVEFCDICTARQGIREICTARQGIREPRGTLPLTGRSVLIVGPAGLSRDVMHDWLTSAGALVDAATAGPATAECLSDSAIVGVPYNVIVLDTGSGSVAATLRTEGCAVPIIAFRPPGVRSDDPQFEGCTAVLQTPIERGADLIEACRRISTRPGA